MKGLWKYFIIGATLCALLSGCSTQPSLFQNDLTTSQENTLIDDQIAAEIAAEWGVDVNTDFEGTRADISYGCRVDDIDSLTDGVLVYSGNLIRVDFYLENTGAIDLTLGLVLWVNGIPQPYSEEPGGETSYVIPYSVSTGAQVNSSAYFTPVTGQAGETLNLTAAFMENSDIRYTNDPYVRHFSHAIKFPCTYLLRMEVNAPTPVEEPIKPDDVQILPQVKYTTESADIQFVGAADEFAVPRVVLTDDHVYTVTLRALGPADEYRATLYINTVPYETVLLPTTEGGYLTLYQTTIDFDALDAEKYAIEEINRLQAVLVGTKGAVNEHTGWPFAEDHDIWIKLK